MKRIITLVLALMLTFLFVGCKSPSEKLGEKLGEQIVGEMFGDGVKIDGDKITFEGEDGSKITAGETDWPKDGLGKEIPKMKDGKITYVISSDAMLAVTLEEVKKGDYEDYLKTAKDAGFVENVATFSDETTSTYIAVNSKQISFQLTYNSDSKELSIIAGKSE